MAKKGWIAGLSGCLLLACWAGLSRPAAAQDPQRIAAFSDARAVSVDPAGVLYVVEGARESIVVLRPGGGDPVRLGGRGSAAGQFDGLADVDPTNGLILVAADAGNGRLQRFSSEFLFLESMPVEATDRQDRDAGNFASYRKQQQDDARGQGRPIAVRTSHAEETFVLDADRGVVLKWDRERNFERVIGGYDAGDGALLDPIALTLDQESGTLLVLDAGHGAVMSYDLLGGFAGARPLGEAADAVSIDARGGIVWIARPDRLARLDAGASFEAAPRLVLDGPIVDLAAVPGGVYILTRRTLYRLPTP
ncbi:MAG: hypothetical protein R2834_08055 [Rhodothermales bacterium]